MNKIGVLQPLTDSGDCFRPVKDFGLDVCQLVSWDMSQATPELADRVREFSAASGVRICAFWAGVPGPQAWNFTEGPVTLGLVPEEYRTERIAALKKWADFAKRIGAPAIITHCGFIPENVTDPAYDGVVAAIKEVAEYCKDLGIGFWFETGQETPVVLLRTIQRIGLDNLGINLDPANLLMYGKGNPIDALNVFGEWVRNIHAKDGLCPTNGDALGKEVPAGQGMVRYPEFIKKLREIGFSGELIIEREIGGEEQNRDIRAAVQSLTGWLGECSD